MTNRDQTAARAHAPYNFVPLPDRVVAAEPVPDHDRYHRDRHTGHFDVTLTTETPLYIRGMLTEAEAAAKEQHKDKADFFQLGGRPIIPGSSLRGMIRSLVEIITFSTIQPVSDRLLIYRAVGDTTSYGKSYRDVMLGSPRNGVVDYPNRNIHGGYLVRHGHEWAIRPAKKINGETFVFASKFDIEVRDVWVKPPTQRRSHQVQKNAHINLATAETISREQGAGLEPGVLIVSGGAPKRKRYPVIFMPDPNAQIIPIPTALWEAYETDRDLQRGIPTRPLREDGDPLFYLLDQKGNLVFFGPTVMFRLPPANSIKDLIPEEAKSADITDMAETIFGWVARDKADKRAATASRISVTDAHPVEGQTDFFEDEFIPKILSGPKPTTFQHYLEQPNGEKTAKQDLKHYAHSVKETQIRGHKLYWRQKGVTVADVRETAAVGSGDKQHTRMRPVKPGMSFTFRVRFENLSDVELGALSWALTLPGNDQHRHQLGMGKPYGMGVVKLEAVLTLTNRSGPRYQSLFNGNSWETGSAAAEVADFITSFEKYVMAALGKPNGKFMALERIQELCVMLTAQLPNPDRFSYMQIEGPNDNEYKDRPVLPYPSVVVPTGVPVLPQAEIPDGTLIQATVIDPSVMAVRLPPEYDEREIKLPPDTKRQARQPIYLQKINGEHEFRVLSKKEWNELMK